MDKVKGQKYLYIRNGMYYFRVVIPKKYRWYFQKTEIRKSLDTSNLRHGISLACEETSSYLNQLKVLDEPVQADNSPAVVYQRLYSERELEQIARAWFTELYNKEDIRLVQV